MHMQLYACTSDTNGVKFFIHSFIHLLIQQPLKKRIISRCGKNKNKNNNNKKQTNKQTNKKTFHITSVRKGSLPFKCFIVANLNSGSPKLVINRKGRKKMTTLKLIAGQLLNRYASVGRAPNGNGGVTGSKLAKDPFGSGFISQSGP